MWSSRGAALLAAVLLLAAPGARGVELEWVHLGAPGNQQDPRTGFGDVPYSLEVGRLEVTNAEYAEALNAVAAADPYGMYGPAMAPGIARYGKPGAYVYAVGAGREGYPVGFVSLWDALRFANWLHNGEPVGAQGRSTTERGAYTFYARNVAGPRNPGARVFLPSENEWFKAAFYDPEADVFYRYATGSNVRPTCEAPPGGVNSAACDQATPLQPSGSYPASRSPFGTLDQSGNTYEWHEGGLTGAYGVRGGSALAIVWDQLHSGARGSYESSKESSGVGFRVASAREGGAAPRCANGEDDDGDGATDYPADLDCSSALDHADSAARAPPAIPPAMPPRCGLLGLEAAPMLALALWRRRRRPCLGDSRKSAI